MSGPLSGPISDAGCASNAELGVWKFQEGASRRGTRGVTDGPISSCASVGVSPFLERVRKRWSRAKEHEGGPMQPELWSSIGTGEIVPPPPYTSAPLRRARRLSPATAPVRMPPWHREFVRKVRPALPLRPYLLSPCGCAPGFAASLPLPSIVAATRLRNQNLSRFLPTIQQRRSVRSFECRTLKFR